MHLLLEHRVGFLSPRVDQPPQHSAKWSLQNLAVLTNICLHMRLKCGDCCFLHRPSFSPFIELHNDVKNKKWAKATLIKDLCFRAELVLCRGSPSLILKLKIQNQFNRMSPRKTSNCLHLPDFLQRSFSAGKNQNVLEEPMDTQQTVILQITS